jgi:hypothetical protein
LCIKIYSGKKRIEGESPLFRFSVWVQNLYFFIHTKISQENFFLNT